MLDVSTTRKLRSKTQTFKVSNLNLFSNNLLWKDLIQGSYQSRPFVLSASYYSFLKSVGILF